MRNTAGLDEGERQGTLLSPTDLQVGVQGGKF